MEARMADRGLDQHERSTLERCETGRTLGTIRHVLVPLDGSRVAECVLPFATLVARVFGAKVTLLRVLEAHSGPAASPHLDPLEWEMSLTAARNDLGRIAGDLPPVGAIPRAEV